MAAVPCTLGAEAWLGIYYMPSPTVVLQGIDSSYPVTGTSGVIPIGATAWSVYDGAGTVVGAGTMLSSASVITVVSTGSFVGGGTAKPGFYTVATNSGTNLVVSGTFVICPASSNLWAPSGVPTGVTWSFDSIGATSQLAAWLGTGPDRDNYPFEGANATGITDNRATDQYFVGPQDAARLRKFRISTDQQATYPTQNPTSTQWGTMASTAVAAGYSGAYYECPSNEPEFGGWTISETVTYWNACAAAILAADPTAHVMGWVSAGIFAESTLANLAAFLAGATSTVAAFSNHMENSRQNMSNITALRQYFGAIKAQFATSGVPTLDLCLTETGINGGGYGTLMPRRDARQRTVLRFVAESYGWAKENHYDFPIYDHFGSGLTSYLMDTSNGGNVSACGWYGNLRAGAYALHVMAEALYGTSCSPTNVPVKLNFGATGSLGDSLFAGTHYTSANGDRVLLATNGLESATVTLAVSVTGTVTYWDGWGVPSTVTVSGGEITIPVNDLLTYVFLPANSTVSVVDTDQGIVAMSSLTDVAVEPVVKLVNGSGSAVGVVNNGSFAENNSGIAGVSAPYQDATVPGTLTLSQFMGGIPCGYAAVGAGNPWQTVGYGLLSVSLAVGAITVDSWTCASAVSLAIPSGSVQNSADPCTRTSWWTGAFARAISFTPTPGSVVTLTATGSYGGQPDAASSVNVTASNLIAAPGGEGDAQKLQLSEFAVYKTATPTPVGSSRQLLNRLAG